MTSPDSLKLTKPCKHCGGTGDEKVQGHPDHRFKCEHCNGTGRAALSKGEVK